MRKYDIDGLRFYSHFPDMIHGSVDTDAWDRKMTGRQKIGMAIVALLFLGFIALASHYDYWFMTNLS